MSGGCTDTVCQVNEMRRERQTPLHPYYPLLVSRAAENSLYQKQIIHAVGIYPDCLIAHIRGFTCLYLMTQGLNKTTKCLP